jgi:hypothetical protein
MEKASGAFFARTTRNTDDDVVVEDDCDMALNKS